MAVITGCKVTKSGDDVITNPTSAVLNDDMMPSANIVITGGTRGNLVANSRYMITGNVADKDRSWNFVCKNAGDPATFKNT